MKPVLHVIQFVQHLSVHKGLNLRLLSCLEIIISIPEDNLGPALVNEPFVFLLYLKKYFLILIHSTVTSQSHLLLVNAAVDRTSDKIVVYGIVVDVAYGVKLTVSAVLVGLHMLGKSLTKFFILFICNAVLHFVPVEYFDCHRLYLSVSGCFVLSLTMAI